MRPWVTDFPISFEHRAVSPETTCVVKESKDTDLPETFEFPQEASELTSEVFLPHREFMVVHSNGCSRGYMTPRDRCPLAFLRMMNFW